MARVKLFGRKEYSILYGEKRGGIKEEKMNKKRLGI